MAPGTDVVVPESVGDKFPILFDPHGGGIAEIIEDNFGDEGFRPSDLDRVKIPAAGGAYWQLPDEPPAKEIEGIIVVKQKTRSYWVKELGDGEDSNEPPDCASNDGKVGVGLFGVGSEARPDGLCATCPMNEFGSGKNNSKACKEQQQLYLLREGSILPMQLTLPPTSLANFRKYMTRLASKALPFYGVITKIGLAQDKGPAGAYSIATFERVGVIEGGERDVVKGYGSTIRESIEQAAAARASSREAAQADVAPSNGSVAPDATGGEDPWETATPAKPAADEPASV